MKDAVERKLPPGIYKKQRKDGFAYYIGFTFEGKQRQECAGTDLRGAKQLLAQRRREMAEGRYDPNGSKMSLTLAEYAESWLRARKKRGVRSWKDEERHLRLHIFPMLGNMPLEGLKPTTVRDWIVHLEDGKRLSPKTIRNIHGTLQGVLKMACFDGRMANNPAADLPRGILPADKKTRDTPPFTREEVEKLVSDDRIPMDRRVLYALMGLTGMRLGEAAGRRWRDIDFAATPLPMMTVATQYDGQPLKTGKSRQVPVHAALCKILEDWRRYGFEQLFCRTLEPDDFIVPNRQGEVRSKNAGSKAINRDCDQVGIPRKGAHSCRRFFITYTRADGARQEVIERVTHNAKGTMVDQYTYFDWDVLCEAVSALKFTLRQGEVMALPSHTHSKVHDGDYDAGDEPPVLQGLIGGGAGSRTRVRKHSTAASTCVVRGLIFVCCCAHEQALRQTSHPLFRSPLGHDWVSLAN